MFTIVFASVLLYVVPLITVIKSNKIIIVVKIIVIVVNDYY